MAKLTKILIVDDTFDNFYLLKAFFSLFSNCKVSWAKNGEEGIDLYNKEHPDLILLDLFMPVVNGFQVLEYIRKTDKDTPIIVASAYSCTENKMEALSNGCNEFIGKPIDTGHLEIVVKKFIDLKPR